MYKSTVPLFLLFELSAKRFLVYNYVFKVFRSCEIILQQLVKGSDVLKRIENKVGFSLGELSQKVHSYFD